MKIAVMQPYFFPYIGYFQLLNAVDKFVVYDDVNYINRGWINRNNILLNGSPFLIQVHLQNASQNRLIHEIELVHDPKWRNKLQKTVEQAYKKAPFFHSVFDLFCSVLHSPETHIAELNLRAMTRVCDYLGIRTEIVPHSGRYQNKHLKGQERILDICRQEGADQYINPAGGQELYDRQFFGDAGVALGFIKTLPHRYTQFGNDFQANLSMLDVMMFNSVDETKNLLTTKYELR